MPGRCPRLIVLVALSWCLSWTGSARAHRLEADYQILPGGRIQIESWFDIGGDSPKEAKVRVFGAGGQTVAEGELDERGLFVFSYREAEPLRVEIVTIGHRKELLIPGERLESAGAAAAAPQPFADRSSRVSAADVLAGIAFVFSLAALVLSIRNGRRLRELRQKLTPRPGDDRE
jgi:hypothetical protein